MALDPQTREAIEKLLSENRIVLFMKGTRQQPQCGFSAKTTAALDMLVPDYVTINVLDYPSVREGIKEFSNWPTIPQLYVDGELIGGSDIVLEMLESGELGEVLGVAKPAPCSPRITISEKAAEAMSRAMASAQPGTVLQLQIDAGWEHSLSMGLPKPDAVTVRSGDIELQLDPWSAARADGLLIDMVEQLEGTMFLFENPNAPPPVNQMSVETLRDKLKNGEELLLFDVRTPEEMASGMIEQGRAWDHDAMAFIDKLPRETELIFYCRSGNRSQQAAEHYRRLGFTNLCNLSGGILAWNELNEASPA